MKKQNIYFFFCTLFVTVSSFADNLIPNGDMQGWSFKDNSQTEYNILPDGFSCPGNANAYYSKGNEQFGENKLNTLRLSYKNNSTGSTRFFSTPYMHLSPGNYELTYFVKGSGFIRSVSLCNEKASDTQRNSIQSYPDTTNSVIPSGTGTSKAILYNDWTCYSFTYIVTKEGTYNLSFANNNREGLENKPFLIAGITFRKQSERAARNFYIDSNTGSDSNNGTSPQTAWKSIRKLNSQSFAPGDSILFARNGVWFEHFKPSGSGSQGKPIVVAAYGTGHDPLFIGKPEIVGEGVVNLHNQSYWEISGLEIINDAPAPGDRRGIQIKASNGGLIRHIHLKNLNIHHIKGIPGDGTEEKRTAGIFLSVDDDILLPTRYDDILVESCHIHHADNQGIALQHEKFTDYPGEGSWDSRKFTKVIVRNNIIHDISKNAMIMRMTEDGIVEKNICFETAIKTQGNTMFSRNVSSVVFRNNEGFRNIAHAHDGCMYDPDLRSLNTLFTDSYSHDNAHGLAWFCTEEKDRIQIKDNISQDDKGYIIYLNYEYKRAEITGNIFYAGKTVEPFLLREHPSNVHGPSIFANNLIYNDSYKFSFEYDPKSRIKAGVNITNRELNGNIYRNNALVNPDNIPMGKAPENSEWNVRKKYHRGFIRQDIIDDLTGHPVEIFRPTPVTDQIVAYVNGIPVYRFELDREMRRLRPLMLTPSQTEINETEIRSAAMEALILIKVQQEWMIRKNLPEGTLLSAVEQLREKENNFRRHNTDNELVIIGPDSFGEDAFWNYFFAKATQNLKKAMMEEELIYTQAELQAHYETGDLDRTTPKWATRTLDYYKSAVVTSLTDRKYKEFFRQKAEQAEVSLLETGIKQRKVNPYHCYVSHNRKIVITGLQEPKQIAIYDLSGRLFEKASSDSALFQSTVLPAGAYIVTLKGHSTEAHFKRSIH